MLVVFIIIGMHRNEYIFLLLSLVTQNLLSYNQFFMESYFHFWYLSQSGKLFSQKKNSRIEGLQRNLLCQVRFCLAQDQQVQEQLQKQACILNRISKQCLHEPQKYHFSFYLPQKERSCCVDKKMIIILNRSVQLWSKMIALLGMFQKESRQCVHCFCAEDGI